jgi:putative PIG3 family NAD(P)H quinone oxidoreductase
MVAIEISSFGPPQVLRPVERAKPAPGPDEVVIAVEAAGVNRADSLQRQGKYPPPPGASDIPGLECAGSVAAVGPNVVQWKIGDRVCALVSGGAYAEFCAAPAVQVLPIPEGWTATEAATLPETLFTVYDNMVTRARLAKGETVLIHGGASGIGSMAIMVARAVGAVPTATAGSDEKCAACRELGAAEAVNYTTGDFVDAVRRFTSDRGVDVVLDIVGASYFERNLEALAAEGRLVFVAAQSGGLVSLNIFKLIGKRASIMGSTLRARTPEQKGAIAERLLRNIWPLLAAKNPIRPVVDSTFPLREAWRAHERLEASLHIGKIVLLPG